MVRRVGTLVVPTLLLLLLVLTAVRWLGPDAHLAVLLASFGFLGLPGYLLVALGLVLLLRGTTVRTPVVAALVLSLAGAAVHAAWLVPSWTGEEPGAVETDGDLTVLTLNLRFGEAAPEEVLALLRDEDPDLVVLTEVTPDAVAALEPFPASLPHAGGRAQPGAAGTVVLSRWPLTDEVEVPLGNSGHRVTVQAPASVGGPLTLDAVHAAYPLQGTGPWARDLATVRRQVEETEGRHLVVGDLNATADHAAYRAVLAAGVRDAAEQAGQGWQPTWPTPGERRVVGLPVPLAMLPLDHVLLSDGLRAHATRTVEVSGTDHLALVAEVSAS